MDPVLVAVTTNGEKRDVNEKFFTLYSANGILGNS